MGRRRGRAEHQSVQHRRSGRPLRARHARRHQAGDRGGQGGVSGVVALGHSGAAFYPDQGVAGDHGAQGRAGRAAEPRRGQDAARRHRRGRARRGRSSISSRARRCGSPARCVPSTRPGVGVEITREAVGVVGIITPWNFPIAIPTWKIAPALVYGNTIVFKPADLVPGSSWAIVDILHRAGLPKGVLNLVMGKGSVVGQAMLESAGHRCLHLHRLGRHRQARSPRRASRSCASSSSKWAARTRPSCSTTPTSRSRSRRSPTRRSFRPASAAPPSSRIIVTEGIHDKFVAALTERVRNLKVGDALEKGIEIGPVVDPGQLKQDTDYIEIGKKEGAKLAAGGELHQAQDARLLPAADAVHGSDQPDAHQPRRDLRAGGVGHPRQELRGSAGDRQRHRVRPLAPGSSRPRSNTRRTSSATPRRAW